MDMLRTTLPRFPTSLLLLVVALVSCTDGISQRVSDPAFQQKLNGLLSNDVPAVDVPALDTLHAPVFLDAREREEYDVSHLPAARWVGYKSFDPALVKDLPKDTLLVVYCSVGYRSERVTEQLRKAGFRNVYNLVGGIFEWVNTDHTVVDEKGPTPRVHAYDKDWGRWVVKGERVY